MNKFSNLTALNHKVSIYVPSNIAGKVVDNSLEINMVRAFLSDTFGGCTTIKAVGAWNNTESGLVDVEDVTIVYANSSTLTDEALNLVWSESRRMKESMNQVCVSVEIDGALYLVD